jgi:hypothetical protein
MVLIHGGDTKGVDRSALPGPNAAASRRSRSLDMRLGARAGFKRNERMLSSIRATSSPFRAMACSNVWSSRPRPGGSPWSIGAGPRHQSEEHFGSH